MLKQRIALLMAFTLGSFAIYGCGDEEENNKMAKVAITAGGALGGAYLGSKMSSPENQTMGTVMGAIAGGGLGYLAGGAIVK